MLRILLTEDDDDQRALFREILTEAGYEVLEARSGHEALELLKRERLDLVVLDIQMPGMDGIDAIGKILALDRRVPVIFHSAFPAYKANFLTWAADAFVVKSGEPNDLVEAIRKVCGDRSLARTSAVGPDVLQRHVETRT